VSHEVTLPVLGESVTEGTVSRWLKKVGETVARDEPLVEISTDKVDTEIPSPVAGVLAEIRIHEDETAAVGAVLAVLNETESQESLLETATIELATAELALDIPAAAPVAEPTPDSEPKGIAPDPFQIPSFVSPPTPQPAADGNTAASPEPLTGATPLPTDLSVEPPPAPASSDATGLNITPSSFVPAVAAHDVADTIGSGAYVTPLVRRLAEEKGVDLAKVQGSGVGGRIRKQDILAAASTQMSPEPQVVDVSAPEASLPQLAMTEAEPLVEPLPSDAEIAPAKTRAKKTVEEPVAPEKVSDRGTEPIEEDSTDMTDLLDEDDYEPTPQKVKIPPRTRKTRRKIVEPEPELDDDFDDDFDDEPELAGTTEKLSRMRATIATRMVESLQSSAQLTATVEVDLTLIARLRHRVKDEFEARKGVPLSFLPFIAKAALEALKAYPKINASIDMDAKEIIYPDGEHLGIAVDTTKGLLVPVIKSAGDLTVSGLAKKINDLSTRARNNRITADELTGGTFTITNYGSVGTLFDTPIVNQPQVAILGAGAIRRRPVAVDDARLGEIVAIRDIMYLSLSYDHRLVDGADAARFLVMIKDRLEAGDFGSEF